MDSPEARRQGVKTLCQEVKQDIKADIVNKIDIMMELWFEMGIRSDAIRSRLVKTKTHVLRLLNDMYEGEIEMKDRIISNVQRCTEEALTLSKQLGVACDLPPENLPILDRESKIRERVEEFQQMKAFRKKEARKLKAEEVELCRSLAANPHILSTGASLLSESDLLELSQHVAALRQEKTIRNCRFSVLRGDIISKLALLDMLPEEGLEQQIVDNARNFVLSDKNMEFLEGYLLRLKSLEAERRQEHAELMERVALFWERLDIPQHEQEEFKRVHDGITPGTISALKQQLEQYERMKKERVKEFIDRTKDDLLTWYSKCCVPELKARFEKDEDSEDFSDQKLEELEEELSRLKEFHAENKPILTKVERREALWTRFLEFEKRAADPSRLNNRGGRLLLEMRERKRLEAELPRLEEEIKTYISRHTGKEEQGFFSEWAKDFLEHLSSQHEAYNQEKDREKQERENRRKEPGTPVSQRTVIKRGPRGTPSSTASRLSRLCTSTATTPTPLKTSRNVTAVKSGPGQRGGTPMRTAPTIRRRSIKGAAQKGASAAARRLLSSAKASPRSSAAAGAVGDLSSLDSFAHYLNLPNKQLLTSSVLSELQATPRPEAGLATFDADATLCEERTAAPPPP